MSKILIIGATSGLGLLLSQYLDQSHELVLVGKDKKKLSELKKIVKNNYYCFAYNLLDEKNIKILFNKIRKKKFDVIIHCIGGGFGKHNPLIGKKDLDFLFQSNVSIVAEINRMLIEKKMFNKNLKIIHIASIAGIEATASVGYSIAKASLISYTKILSKKLINKNIFVHCILPGAFECAGNSFERLKLKNNKIYKKFIKEKLPRNRISKGREFLGLFKLLISNEGNILSGSPIVADYSETNTFLI